MNRHERHILKRLSSDSAKPSSSFNAKLQKRLRIDIPQATTSGYPISIFAGASMAILMVVISSLALNSEPQTKTPSPQTKVALKSEASIGTSDALATTAGTETSMATPDATTSDSSMSTAREADTVVTSTSLLPTVTSQVADEALIADDGTVAQYGEDTYVLYDIALVEPIDAPGEKVLITALSVDATYVEVSRNIDTTGTTPSSYLVFTLNEQTYAIRGYGQIDKAQLVQVADALVF